MRKLKVMVIDDSAFIRMIIGEIISQHEDMEVIATAKDGMDALEKLKFVQPDVITLDVEMPKMDGLDTLDNIRQRYDIPVIMLSSLTDRNSKYTLEALAKGAYDFIEKPSNNIKLDRIKNELYEKIISVRYISQPSVQEQIYNQSRNRHEGTYPSIYKEIQGITIGAST